MPDSNELKSIDSVGAVNAAIRQYIQYRQPLAAEFALRLRELRDALEGDDVFMSHSFVRTPPQPQPQPQPQPEPNRAELLLERFFVRDEAARRLQRAWLTHLLDTGQLSSDDAKVRGGMRVGFGSG